MKIYARNEANRMTFEVTSDQDIADINVDLQDAFRFMRQLIVDQRTEPNDALARATVEKKGSTFMDVLLTRGQFSEAMVVCNATNNPPSIIDAGQLVLTVHLKTAQGDIFAFSFFN